MSFGKSKSKSSSKKISIPAPPQIQQFEFRSPVGDVFRSRQEGNTQINEADLGTFSRGVVAQSQQGISQLGQSLGKTDSKRASDIKKRSDDFFRLQARGIHRDADDIASKTRSQLSRRFGGSLNSTFGSDLLSRLEENRLNQLNDARRSANLLGEELALSDENSKIRRIGVFENFLNKLSAQAQGSSQIGSNLLLNENRRATDLAISRANLLNRALQQDNRNQLARRQQNLSLVGRAISAFF